jgi:hypothetical protein
MKTCTLLLLLATSQAFSEPVIKEFPADAVAIPSASLQEALAGKIYSATPAEGPRWRWQFDANGHFFLNVGNFNDSGKWSAKDNSLCSEGKKINASCNEVRQKGSDLFLKRDSGEIVRMTPQ